MNAPTLVVFLIIFFAVSVGGFAAARFGRSNHHDLSEWSLGGRRFGTVLSWFLIGGDLYTAYTFIAIPALVYGAGALGFYGVPYTILIYPLIFAIMPRLWSVCRRYNYVTAADFVRARFGHRSLAVAVALSGILATLPYIALQLTGMQVVISALGFPMTGMFSKLPLLFAFSTVAAYTYSSGIRAPAVIAVAKDILIYVTIIAAIAVIPARLGGFSAIFAHVKPAHVLLPTGPAAPFNGVGYASLALGSAIALLFYPHSLTAILSARNTAAIRRNAMLLPAYSLLLGFLSLLGCMAAVAAVEQVPRFGLFFAAYHTSFAVPALFMMYFPQWFVGVAFAAIVIGALVPASIMAIAAANLFVRNIHLELINPKLSAARQTEFARRTSLAVLFGSLAFMSLVPTAYAIQLQMLGGVWIIQTAPIIIGGLFMPFLRPRSLFAGWAGGMLSGTILAWQNNFTPLATLSIGGAAVPLYIAILALLVHLGIAVVGSLVENAQPRLSHPETPYA